MADPAAGATDEVKGVVTPPEAVVVPQMVVGVGGGDTDGQTLGNFVGGHDREKTECDKTLPEMSPGRDSPGRIPGIVKDNGWRRRRLDSLRRVVRIKSRPRNHRG